MRLTVLLAAVALFLATACGGKTQSASWFRIAGEATIGPTLTIADVDRGSARAETDPATSAPVVYLRLTKGGQRKFASLSRQLAKRGQRAGRSFHFVITVDGHVLERAYVDYRVNPEGIPADQGIQLDLRTPAQARTLAKRLQGD